LKGGLRSVNGVSLQEKRKHGQQVSPATKTRKGPPSPLQTNPAENTTQQEDEVSKENSKRKVKRKKI